MIKFAYSGSGTRGWEGIETRHDRPFLVELYRRMLRIRLIEEAIEARYHEDQMKSPIHLVIGQEATSVGVCAAMRLTDHVYSSHRTHGNYLAKGGDLGAMLSELHCRANGCAGSRGGSMHLVDPAVGMAGASAIVGGIVPIAVGAALSARMQGLDRVCVPFFGDAATEEGVVWESQNFAALKKLPVVFVCENNFFSVFSPVEKRQPPVPIHEKARAFGLRTELVDGTNVVEVYEAASRLIEAARLGDGPGFLEAVAYRWRGHGGGGDDSKLGYRDRDEVEHWQDRCPIALLGSRLQELGWLDGDMDGMMREAIQDEIAEAFAHALSSPEPTAADLATFVYAE